MSLDLQSAAVSPSATALPSELVAEGLVRRFAGRTVVDHVSLEVRRGEVLALLGPNGAGKSTLMRLLVGALRPEGGRVILGGEDVTRLPLHLRGRRGLGYLPQEPSAFTGLSVEDNLALVLELRGQPRAAGEAALALFELEPRRNQRASTLSGGERRRLELARLLCTRPTVALLDEPFAGLDPRAAEQLALHIARLAEHGVGVLLADHRAEQALAICHRACLLVDGRVAVCGSPKELWSDSSAQRAYFGSLAPYVGSGAWH
ncbi:MAG: ATP-binding cassette domain-containing protein [Deltaproteobacteria bacterium]|nr:ATP-binding cassette domain-containing protein [Deltaproteobacteria bacterium]